MRVATKRVSHLAIFLPMCHTFVEGLFFRFELNFRHFAVNAQLLTVAPDIGGTCKKNVRVLLTNFSSIPLSTIHVFPWCVRFC